VLLFLRRSAGAGYSRFPAPEGAALSKWLLS